jgi:hypothetical protein
VDRRVRALLDEVAAWAGTQADVRAVLLVGSQARADTPADEFSDVDLGLFVDDPEHYLRDGAWVRSFGEPLLTLLEPTAVGGFEEGRVLFQDGLEVDFSILPAPVAKAPPAEADAVLGRGFCVVYDGIGLDDLEPAGTPPTAPPTQAALEQLSSDFWYHVLWARRSCGAASCWWPARCATATSLGLSSSSHGGEHTTATRGTGIGFSSAGPAARPPRRSPRHSPSTRRRNIARALRAKGELFGRPEDDVVQRFDLVDTVDRSEVMRRLDALLRS